MSDNNIPRPVLHPVFGTSCRTQAYAMETGDAYKSKHTYLEIYLEDPVKKTWAVNSVMIFSKHSFYAPKDETRVSSRTIARKLDIVSALAMLSAFEKDCASKPAEFKALFPEAPLMGFSHYKAFAEREGYIFDSKGFPQIRPARHALPEGDFLEADIKSAAQNVQRPEDAFRNNGVVNKIPSALFIFDGFNRAAHKHTPQEALAETRILSILDRLSGNVDKAHLKMQEYCASFGELGHGDLIAAAETALSTAEASVRQLKAYGVETADFESFVAQCQIICNVLHAQGLYDLMHQGKGDYAQNEALFKERITKALAAYEKLDAPGKDPQLLEDMIVQAPRPQVPEAIGLFVTNYKQQRAILKKSRAP